MESITWAITTGCDRISPGCYSCPSYWQAMRDNKSYRIDEQWHELYTPKYTKESTNYQVSLGSDLFHADVSSYFIHKVFEEMNIQQKHTFEILTKRIERVRMMCKSLKWTSNIFLGVAVESEEYVHRIHTLRDVPSQNRYVSMYPILGPMGKLNLDGIHLVAAGKETWGYQRPCMPEWVDDVKTQCESQGVMFSDAHRVLKLEMT